MTIFPRTTGRRPVALRHIAQVGACAGVIALSAAGVGCGAAASGLAPADTRLVTRVESAMPAEAGRAPTRAARERALRLAVARLRVAVARIEGKHLVTSATARALSNRLDAVEHGIEMLDRTTGSRERRLEGSLSRLRERAGVEPVE